MEERLTGTFKETLGLIKAVQRTTKYINCSVHIVQSHAANVFAVKYTKQQNKSSKLYHTTEQNKLEGNSVDPKEATHNELDFQP